MPVRIRRNRAHPSPSSPYYKFGFQRPAYPFNWYGGAGGVPLNTRPAGETRGLSGCLPCSVGSADILESDRDEAIHYPAFKRTAIHRGALGGVIEYITPSSSLPGPAYPPPPPQGNVRKIASSRQWQGRSPLTQPWPMSGFFGDVWSGVTSATGAIADGVKDMVAKVTGARARPSIARAQQGPLKGLDDWPLVIPEGPEPLIYPGEMGAWDFEQTALIALVGVGIYYLVKRKKRTNPSRRRRRHRRRR